MHEITATWHLKAFLLLICNNWKESRATARVQCWWKRPGVKYAC